MDMVQNEEMMQKVSDAKPCLLEGILKRKCQFFDRCARNLAGKELCKFVEESRVKKGEEEE